MITKKLKADWLRRLRGGRYKQTVGRLYRSTEAAAGERIPPGYCCLGVLAMAAGKKRAQMGLGGVLSSVGLGNLISEAQESELATRNDTFGWTFPEIADWIEANIKTGKTKA